MQFFFALALISAPEPSSFDYNDPAFDKARAEVAGEDLSTNYQQLFADEVPLSERDLALLRKSHILIVPGFLSDVASGLRGTFADLIPWVVHKDDGGMAWLKKNQIPFSRVELESEAPPSENAPQVERAILSSEAPVILLSHSKGGLDIMEALIHQRELWHRVRGWIAIQPPFFGTPVSDVWIKEPGYRKALDKVLIRLGGSVESLVSMQMKERLPYMERNSSEISALVAKVPTITLGGDSADVPGRWDTLFEPYWRDQMKLARIENDGVVPWRNTVIPGNPFVRAMGVDHLMPIGAMHLTPFDREKFIQVMLKLLIQQGIRLGIYQ